MRKSYTTYSIACFLVWAVILIVASVKNGSDKYFFVFGGWVIGWLSATIARSVYPPPSKNRSDGSG
jgi:hypothetical protein